MPNLGGYTHTTGAQDSGRSRRSYNSQEYDVESNKEIPTPTSAAFPGATYGLNPSDESSHPPRRVKSNHSLSLARNKSVSSLRLAHNKSVTSLVDPDSTVDPVPPLPALPHPQGQNAIGTINNTTTDHNDDNTPSEELAWGPSHPCFPHLNPHVPLSSPLYESTRIIRIRRDWMIAGDLAPTFSNIYPEILDPSLTEPEFRNIITHINATLLAAFDPFSTVNWLDGLLGLVTGWLWEDFRPPVGGVKGKLRNLETWIDHWNETVGARSNVKLISLRRTAYMGLDIQIPDPQVKVVDGSEERTGTTPTMTEGHEGSFRMERGSGIAGGGSEVDDVGGAYGRHGSVHTGIDRRMESSIHTGTGVESGSMIANVSGR